MNCSIGGCLKEASRRGWCGTHYARWRRRGDPNKAWQTLSERWEKYVEKSPDCWLWVGGQDGKGYGNFRVDKVHQGAHRVGWFLKYARWPKELDHLCKVKSCVNPDHLEEVSHAENIRRANIPRNNLGRYVRR